MCGICGFVNYGAFDRDHDHRVIGSMHQRLIHRGPDAQDTLQFGNVALGFTRLSIIGLQDGMQPLTNEDGSLVLICNGEIFNYIELKESLLLKGHTFKTATDVEVLLHLYEEHGPAFLNQLNGQFAFALYDKRQQRLFCARDQLGIIPFYYTFAKDTFIFASEIKAILEHPHVSAATDLTGLDQVLTFAGLISPRTMFRDIRSLENGHYLLVNERGEIKDVEYWDLIYPEESMIPDADEAYYTSKLGELFNESVRLRLRADVPSGLYVSGGLDSSIIAMKVKQLMPDAGRLGFSIDFTDSIHSESVYQQLIAKASGVTLHQKLFPYHEITDRLKTSVYYSECPIKETYNTASMALSETVRRLQQKVILSGEGADEFFAGYVGYRFDKMKMLSGTTTPASAAEMELRNRLWGNPDFFYERNYLEYEGIKRSLYSAAVNDTFDTVNCLNYPLINQDRVKGRDILNTRAYIDYKIRLVDHLVSDHGDRMAMANSVEVRYPFLDKNLVEFSAAIPSELKLNGFTEKYILRKMGEPVLPQQIMEREKFHFIAPGSPYLLQQNNEYINELLSFDRIKRQGYFNPATIDELAARYRQEGFTINAPYETDLLITVITFGMLLDTFFE
ncbi:asparagine synthase (glutamine-hydrolysing) [Chitinophaga costaii]|uniref:asparagine synthase (glutamine-hydrolyzing) n=1 Tax=Chitinophaga costaii TaxID=1335309 RepID=A0A1C3YU25_9BACT|nr:asparagine synthase (glutamine-hydrolyzing) [Chitinophaga costaii]PUZ30105.1 asparagine synthase (glutamine-hydrolyzing) [Chitinophaga costaii]SCB73532.1 asparagine synthase (glutamine-hydrolysing) [Chitinophaga costaii]